MSFFTVKTIELINNYTINGNQDQAAALNCLTGVPPKADSQNI